MWQSVETAPADRLVLVLYGKKHVTYEMAKYTHDRGWLMRAPYWTPIKVPRLWHPLPEPPHQENVDHG